VAISVAHLRLQQTVGLLADLVRCVAVDVQRARMPLHIHTQAFPRKRLLKTPLPQVARKKLLARTWPVPSGATPAMLCSCQLSRVSGLLSDFLSSDCKRRSTFLTSCSGGRLSGLGAFAKQGVVAFAADERKVLVTASLFVDDL
jgi:hypothetical protein